MNIIGPVTIQGDVIESGGTKTVNNYFGEKRSKEEDTSKECQTSNGTDVFDRAKIESYVVEGHSHEVAEILIDLMTPFCGKNKPKDALLPLYCACELNWIRRLSYDVFTQSFGALAVSKTSYSEYMPKKENSNYNQEEIDRMSETITARLNEKIK